MEQAVIAGGLAVAALNGICALLGAYSWYREQPLRAFWLSLRIAQGSAVALALAVGALALAGRQPREQLFYLYALLPLAIAFVAEQLRVTAAQTVLDRRGLADAQAVGARPQAEQLQIVAAIIRREVGVMALSALVVVFLALRAAGTANGL